MTIDLKSNRSFIIKALLPFIIISFILIIFIGIALIMDYQVTKNLMSVLLAVMIEEIFLVGIVVFAKFYKGKSYKFSENKIIVYNKGTYDKEISLENIESMNYFKFKFRYIITIYAGALNEGSCWRLYLKFNNGSKTNIACFSIKDIEKLKELYPNLITIK